MRNYTHFSDMPVWKQVLTLIKQIYLLTRSFPSEEKYGLTNQVRRAAVSISANIAEGYGRRSGPDKKRFYEIARSSAFEVQNLLLVSAELGFLDINECDKLNSDLDGIIHSLNKIKASL